MAVVSVGDPSWVSYIHASTLLIWSVSCMSGPGMSLLAHFVPCGQNALGHSEPKGFSGEANLFNFSVPVPERCCWTANTIYIDIGGLAVGPQGIA